MKNISISLGLLLFILLLSFFGPRSIYLFERGLYYGYDITLEYKISKALDKVRQSKNLHSITLQKFTNKKIRRACVQSPYITQTLFEELIGEKVSGFTEVSDHDGYILWIFFLDGSTSRIRIFMSFWSNDDRSKKEVSNSKKLHCTKNTLALFLRPISSKSNSNLVSDEIYFYYFNEEN